MATKTIGQLTQATTINNADEFAIEQSGVTKRVAASVVRGDIINANIKSDAAIAYSKLAALNSAQILVGNGSNVPTAVSVTGDVTISNAGVTAIAAGAVVTADVANAAITPAKLSQPYTLATAQNSTSGTSIDFTGIPSWAKRVTIMFSDVSTNGSSSMLVQIGSGSVVSSGYNSTSGVFNFTSGTGGANSSAGFCMSNAAAYTICGHMNLTLLSGSIWTASHAFFAGNSGTGGAGVGGGRSPSLSGTLDRVRITTVNGTDTFDAGTINISYEG